MDLNHVTLPVTDLSRSVAFYKNLGFTQIVDSPPRYARFECRPGGSTFSLHRTDEVPVSTAVIVYFECRELDAAVSRLKDLGVTFESDPADRQWLWREAYLRDPDGNLLCLYYAGENRLYPPWRID